MSSCLQLLILKIMPCHEWMSQGIFLELKLHPGKDSWLKNGLVTVEFTSQEYNSLYRVLSRFIGPFHGESRHVKNQQDQNQKGTILTTLDGPLTPDRSGSHLYIPQKRSWGLTTLIAAKKARPFLKKKNQGFTTHQKSCLSHAAKTKYAATSIEVCDDGEKLWKGFPICWGYTFDKGILY